MPQFFSVRRGTKPSLYLFGKSKSSASKRQLKNRRGVGYHGRGAYSLGKAWRMTAGKHLGRRIRSAIGDRLISAISDPGPQVTGSGLYTGRGAYKNSLMSDRPAQVISSAADETGAVTISKLEFLTEIYGPNAAFNVQSFPLNPGLESTFPWVSQVAQNYEEYELLQCVFSYRSTVTDIGNSTNGQCGTIMMATVYDASSAPFTDKKALMAYDASMSCKTTESMHHGVECDPSKNSGSSGKYVRAFGLSQDKDIKDYDHGIFQLAIANSPLGYIGASLGELWVSYTIRLRKPKFFSARGLNISRDIYVSDGAETASNLFGTNSLRALANNINTKFVSDNGWMRITFPADYAGVVAVLVRSEGAANTFTAGQGFGTVILTGNVTPYNDMYAVGSGAGDSPGNTCVISNANAHMAELHYKISPSTNGFDNKIEIPYTSGAGNFLLLAPTQSCLEIKEINSGFSYAYANIGTSDAPILVTPSGAVKLP